MNNITKLGNRLFGRLSICARIGAITGAISGFLFGLLQTRLAPEETILSNELLIMGLMLGILGWVTVLILVGAWMKYGVGNIAILSLLVSISTSVVVVYLLYLINFPPVSMLFGMLLGILIGAFICWLVCRSKWKYLETQLRRRLADDKRND
ncbi:hypothetical protein ACFLRB_06845 [Acidobacteriota bacterium]